MLAVQCLALGAGKRRAIVARQRIGVAVLTGLLTFLGVALAWGGIGSVRGAADNGDGARLFCGAGIAPATPDSASNWKGGVVLNFSVVKRCSDSIPSSALPILEMSKFGSGQTYSLTRLGWAYTLLIALTVAIATWASTRVALWRALILLPVVSPLALANFSRFFVSTYSEPSGLAGLVALLSGICVVLCTCPTCRVERVIAFGLIVSGTFVAVTSKIAYSPLVVVGVVACLLTEFRTGSESRRIADRTFGIAATVFLLVALVIPMKLALEWQAANTQAINTHNLVYTTVLVEVPGADSELGLPSGASKSAGTAYYPDGPAGVVGSELISTSPSRVRKAATWLMISNPKSLLRAVGISMQATLASSLGYLPSEPWNADSAPLTIGQSVGEQGAKRILLQGWLDQMSLPWLPSAVAILGVSIGVIGLFRRERFWGLFAVVAGVAGFSSVVLATTAVLGDGYFEIAKHVWLSSYCIAVASVAIFCSAIAVILERMHFVAWSSRLLEGVRSQKI